MSKPEFMDQGLKDMGVQIKTSDTNTVEQIVACLLTGGVVLLPTDTVYGLAALPAFEQAVNRVYTLKRRPTQMHLPIMVAAEEELGDLGLDVNDTAALLLRSPLIPGSLTLVMGFRPHVLRPRWLQDREEAAVRIPNDRCLLAVLKKVGPLLVTSANAHGAEIPENITDILAQLRGAPDLVIDGGIPRTIPSTLVNCRYHPPVIERRGAISEAEIMEHLK